MSHAGIVIVTYNSADHIAECLTAATRSGWPVLVVDNASQDGTLDVVRQFSSVRLLRNQENRGFAGGVNQGIRELATSYVLLFNPDTILLDPLEPLLQAARGDRVAAVGGRLVGTDGTTQTGFTIRRFPTWATLAFEVAGINRLWPSNPVNRRYRCLDLDLDRPAEGIQPAGAFLLIRTEAWEELKGFDERYFPVWFEEVDFLRRAITGGWRSLYLPNVRASHTGGGSVNTLTRERRQIYWYANVLSYAFQTFRLPQARLLCLVLIAASVPRAIFEAMSRRDWSPFRLYGRIIALAWKAFWRRYPSAGGPPAGGRSAIPA